MSIMEKNEFYIIYNQYNLMELKLFLITDNLMFKNSTIHEFIINNIFTIIYQDLLSVLSQKKVVSVSSEIIFKKLIL